jgi:SAM-dependent methyltransferase
MALDALICYALAIMAMYVLFVAVDCQVVDLSDDTLTGDIRLINTLYNIEEILEHQPSSSEMREYYEQTTDRDYALLERIMGPGMHTRLGRDNARQFKYVMDEIKDVEATHVLEIGCGKGHSRVLARMMPSVQFTGIDMVARHVEIARSLALGNVEYFQADATKDISWLGKFQVIFGVESMCHMDSEEARERFVRQARMLLAPGGKIVIVDGFRAESFADASPDQQLAMRLAERGFSIARMPSKADWIRVADAHTAHFTDLTADAILYWTMGWRIARFLLHFPLALYYYASSSRARVCTLMNLLSVVTVAHAMRDSATAEYGVLVMT